MTSQIRLLTSPINRKPSYNQGASSLNAIPSKTRHDLLSSLHSCNSRPYQFKLTHLRQFKSLRHIKQVPQAASDLCRIERLRAEGCEHRQQLVCREISSVRGLNRVKVLENWRLRVEVWENAAVDVDGLPERRDKLHSTVHSANSISAAVRRLAAR